MDQEANLRQSVSEYGKQVLSEIKQVKILYFILEDAKNRLEKNSEIYRLIEKSQSRLNNEKNLKNAIKIANSFIIDLETTDQDRRTINYLKKNGFYRILYRNPQIMGQELRANSPLRTLLRNGFVGVAISALIIILFAATASLSGPFWLTAVGTGLFVGATAYLSGILYGVLNDLFATHANLPYFLLGHQPQQTSLLRTNDKVAQAIACGVAATFKPVVIATILFTFAGTITAFFVPIATFLLPAMMIAMPLIAVGAEFYARKKTREYISVNSENYSSLGANHYQVSGLNYMSPTKAERAAWLANSDRNLFGFTKVPLIGLGALVGLIVLSTISMFLPPLLFVSPFIAIAIPVAFASVTCVFLIASGVYMYANREKQVDDRYRLEFDRSKIEPNLYLDEDLPYVNRVLKEYEEQKSGIEDKQSAAENNSYAAIFLKNIDSEDIEARLFALKAP